MNNLLKIKDVSLKYDVTTRTLRYYEDKGLIISTRSDDYAYRMYDENAIRRLEQILILRKLNISIKDIQRIFSTSSSSVVLEVLEKKVQSIDDEVSLLHELKDIVLDFIHEIERVNFADNADVKSLYDKAKDIETQLISVDYIGKPSNVNRLLDVTDKLKKVPDVKIIHINPFKAVTTGLAPFDELFGPMGRFMNLMEKNSHRFMKNVFGDLEFLWIDCPNNLELCPTCGENCQMQGQFMWPVEDNVTGAETAPFEIIDFKGGMYAVATSVDQEDIIGKVAEGIHTWLESSGFESDYKSGRKRLNAMVKATPEIKAALGYDQQDIYIPIKPRKKPSDEIVTGSTNEKYEFNSPTWWTGFSKYYQLSGDFELTFKLNLKGGNFAYNSYSTAFTNAQRFSDKYFEIAILRSDTYGWGGGHNMTFDGGMMIHEKDYETDEEFAECMKDANVVHEIIRSGNDFTSIATFTGKNGSVYTRKTTFKSEAPNEMFVFLVTDGSSVTIDDVIIY